MIDSTDFEEEYLDILQNIEMAIVSVYRQNPDLIDANVETAIQALIKTYRSQRTPEGERPPASPAAYRVYAAVKAMCDWRLGEEELLDQEDARVDLPIELKSPEEIIACLQRIRRSIRTWNKQGGRQGYLNFVSQFIP
jgi:hypothetical protein